MFEVLEHISRPRKFLKDVSRVLKGSGYLIISIPNASFQIRKERVFKLLHIRKEEFLATGEHLIHYTRKTIQQLLHNTGFSIIKLENSRMVLGPQANDFKLLKIIYQSIADFTYYLAGYCIGRSLFIIAQKSLRWSKNLKQYRVDSFFCYLCETLIRRNFWTVCLYGSTKRIAKFKYT